MRSPTAPSVRPAFGTARTPTRPTHGPVIAAWAAAIGKPLMPWQAEVLDVATEVLPDGSWAYETVVVTVQRQAGKTTLVGPMACERCQMEREAMTWFTAQTRQDARDTMVEGFHKLVEDLAGGGIRPRLSNGSEGLYFPGGSFFRVFAPTGSALHGKANRLVVVDEVWAFTGPKGLALEQAILPTFTTTGGQLWLVSAAGTAESAWLQSWVDRGRAAVAKGRTRGLAYFEFALPAAQRHEVEVGLDAGKLDPDSPLLDRALELVAEAHPANGYTLKLSALRNAAASMAVGEFLRAYGNVWTEAVERVITAKDWADCEADTDPDTGKHLWAPPATRVALAFDVAMDRSKASILAGWRDTPDGPMRWDVLEDRPGQAWVAARVRELREKWRPIGIGHNGGPAGPVADELTRAGVELVAMKTGDYATACASVLKWITDTGHHLQHWGQPPLEAAVAAAVKRDLGDGWAWDRRESGASIAPLVAGTVAAWVFDHAPKPLPKPQARAATRRVAAVPTRRRRQPLPS